MNRLNFIFKTQAEYDQLVTDGQLIPNTHYFISVGGNKFRQNYVNAAGTVYQKEDLAGLDETALATYLATNGYITQSQLDAAIANFVTSTELQTEVDALNQSFTAVQTAANNAQTTADQAVTDAAAALTAANNAQTTANQGVTDAAAALTAANNAQTTADQAVTDAAAAQADADTAIADAANALTQVAALAIAVRLGLRSIVAPLGSVQTAIDAAITAAEEGTYCATVLGIDDSTPETITVGGVTLELNTSCAVYFKIDNTGSVSEVHLDNNSSLARVIALEQRLTEEEDTNTTFRAWTSGKVSDLFEAFRRDTQNEHSVTIDIAELGGFTKSTDWLREVGLMTLAYQSPNYNLGNSFRLAVTFKGEGTGTILKALNATEASLGNGTELAVADGTVMVCTYDMQSDNITWNLNISPIATDPKNSFKYYPAAPNAALQMELMPFDTTRFFGTNETTNPQTLLSSFQNQLGKPTFAMSKVITVTYRCNKVVTGVVTLVHEFANPNYDANDPNSPEFIENTYTLGDDSLIQFTATYNPTADEWTVNDTTLSVSESYNALQQGTFS